MVVLIFNSYLSLIIVGHLPLAAVRQQLNTVWVTLFVTHQITVIKQFYGKRGHAAITLSHEATNCFATTLL